MSIGADLIRYTDRKILIFDDECQRVNLMQDNLPYEHAWIVAQKGEVLERHHYYLNWGPNYRMSPDAAKITRFNPEWVKNGTDPEFVLNAWESYALDESYLLGGHNIIGFDHGLWQLWREALGRKRDWSAQHRMIDSHLLARAYKMGWKPDRDNLLAWFYKVYNTPQKGVKTGLALMAKELGVEVDETKTHGAFYDIEITLGVIWKLVNLIEI